jgi:hypothetical protein
MNYQLRKLFLALSFVSMMSIAVPAQASAGKTFKGFCWMFVAVVAAEHCVDNVFNVYLQLSRANTLNQKHKTDPQDVSNLAQQEHEQIIKLRKNAAGSVITATALTALSYVTGKWAIENFLKTSKASVVYHV